MINLSVNINKIATIRNARGGNTPDLLKLRKIARLSVRKVLPYTPVPTNAISGIATSINSSRLSTRN